MPDQTTYNLGESESIKLDASGGGSVEIGPGTSGPANWRVTGVILQTDRPGQAPVPRAQVYLNVANPNGSQGITYDGSFAQGSCDLTIARGQFLIATWTGGKQGDTASITVTGVKW